MKHTLRIAALAAAVALAGCAAPVSTVQSPEQAVFAIKSGYAVALNAAVAYRRLPECAAPPVPPCHSPAVLAQLREADNAASAALTAAEVAVRSPGAALAERARLLREAQAALAALTAVTNQLGSPK